MSILHHKKTLTVASFMAFVVLGAAITQQPTQERNLQILPKDISNQKLDSIMHSYNKALGVDCKFCHAANNSLVFGAPSQLDFASDKEPMKGNARDMMRMMIDINSKYFYFDKNQQPVYLNTISCITCHRGQALPEEIK
jgi:hypothetical protein